MRAAIYARQAWVNLLAAKLRSLLAVLGILVGTAAVVALLSSGKLATEKALEQFKALGTDLLSLSVYPMGMGDHSGESAEVTLEQWRRFPEQIKAIKKIAPYATHYQTITFNGKELQGAIIGADEALANIIHITLERGHFVSFIDTFEHYCVIGDGLYQQIRTITQDEPLGKQLKIGNTLYTIIGIAQPWKENGFFNEDINRSVIVPLKGMVLINKNSKVNNAIMVMNPDRPIDETLEELKQLVHSISPKLSLFPRSAKQIIASMESQGRIFTLLLAVIGGISLLVGGIGIMNVMLVSVSERKKEIGIRKAVGAKNREIQALFLTESVILGLTGGFLGVILGLIVTGIIAWFSDWPFHWYLLPPLAGFLVSAATGIFFGYYPARRAARLQPIESLRSE